MILQNDPYCQGVVMLGLNRPLADFKEKFSETKGISIVKGFAIGRSIFKDPVIELLTRRIDNVKFTKQLQDNFLTLVDFWDNR